jgi:hypothetical protein
MNLASNFGFIKEWRGSVSNSGVLKDARRSFYLCSKQDDFAEFATEPYRSKDVGILYGSAVGFASSFNLPRMISKLGDKI